MSMRLYLAMTAGEYRNAESLPEAVAWMACHFSCYGSGLCNLPAQLPEGSMLIVNDRTPIHKHDPGLIAEQLSLLWETLHPACILLDLQRSGVPEAEAVVRSILGSSSCPVGVAEPYARDLECPVFLSPPPLHLCLEEYLEPWNGREIWLEAAPDAAIITVTAQGALIEAAEIDLLPSPNYSDPQLHCHYHIALEENDARFTLQRNKVQLEEMLVASETLGVTQAVGLYQQLK